MSKLPVVCGLNILSITVSMDKTKPSTLSLIGRTYLKGKDEVFIISFCKTWLHAEKKQKVKHGF